MSGSRAKFFLLSNPLTSFNVRQRGSDCLGQFDTQETPGGVNVILTGLVHQPDVPSSSHFGDGRIW